MSVVFPETPVSSTNKTDRHVIVEMLSKVALNTITLTLIKIEWTSVWKIKDKKGEIRSRTSKERQTIQWPNDITTNNDVHKTLHRKQKIEQHEPGMLHRSCSTCNTRRITLVTNPVINHEYNNLTVIFQMFNVSFDNSVKQINDAYDFVLTANEIFSSRYIKIVPKEASLEECRSGLRIEFYGFKKTNDLAGKQNIYISTCFLSRQQI